MKARRTILLIAAAQAGVSAAGGDAARPAPPPPMKIILAGDSTTAQQTGWGGAFCDLHVSQYVACLPMGRGGRSTKTYRADGSWQLVLEELAMPGYARRFVVIGFGHNDKNADPAIGTRLDTEFPRNLTRMIADVRSRHAEPILLTPLATRHFIRGQLADTLVPWAAQVRIVAAREHVAVIDLNRSSEEAFRKLGPVGSLDLEKRPASGVELAAARSGTTLPARLPTAQGAAGSDPRQDYQADYVHLNERGARMISALVAQGMRLEVPPLHGYIAP